MAAAGAVGAAATEVGVLVIGGGAVGLSVAGALARRKLGRSVLLAERHSTLGWETSSHNSEVVHASVYYPANSLKSRLCLRGNRMLYDICARHGIPHKKTGKLLVPRSREEVKLLPRILATALGSGGEGVRLVNKEEIRDLEPNVEADAAIYCPTTGIVDSHALLQHYEAEALQHGVDIARNAEIVGIEKFKGIPAYKVTIEDVDLSGPEPKSHGTYIVQARAVVNCAGLGSGRIAALAGIDLDEANYRLHPTKGVYFRAHKNLDKYPKMLVYPLPIKGAVGAHTTPDLYGGMRLGPMEFWLADERDPAKDFNNPANRSYIGSQGVDMTVSPELKQAFVDFLRPFLPFLTPDQIEPDSAGLHPKLQSEAEDAMRDWVIKHEADRRLPNFFNLVGIESPGLTASAALGEYVADMVQAEVK